MKKKAMKRSPPFGSQICSLVHFVPSICHKQIQAFVKTGNLGYTPRKINIESENDGLEDDFPFPGMHSQVPC